MDLYLRAADEAAMNAELLTAGLVAEQTVQVQTGEDGDGNPILEDATVLVPALGVNLDAIGPITKWDYTVDPPAEIVYPEWHVNVRSYDLTEEQLAGLADVMIIPPELPFRVWA